MAQRQPDESEKDEGAELRSKRAALATAAIELSDIAVEDLHTCLQIVKENMGHPTPVESFVAGVIRAYEGANGALTPDMAAEYLATFREEFTEAIEIARRMRKTFPELAAGGVQ